MNGILLFKLFSTPLLVWLSIWASRRWGAFVGGCIAGLPSISGPISFCIALEQGTDFAAAVAYNALFGVSAVCVFTLTYAWIAQRHAWYVALATAEAAYFATGWVVGFAPQDLTPLAVAVGLAGPPLTLACMPKLPSSATDPMRPQSRWLVPAQMLLGALVVLTITETALRLGAHWSGVLTFYPVMVSILTPFCHAEHGPRAARQLLGGLMTGFVGGTSFTVVVLFGVQTLPIAVCYSLAAGLSLLLCTVVGLFQQKRSRLLQNSTP